MEPWKLLEAVFVVLLGRWSGCVSFLGTAHLPTPTPTSLDFFHSARWDCLQRRIFLSPAWVSAILSINKWEEKWEISSSLCKWSHITGVFRTLCMESSFPETLHFTPPEKKPLECRELKEQVDDQGSTSSLNRIQPYLFFYLCMQR